MGALKRFAEEVSVEMGFGGELTQEVLTEAQRRIDAGVEICRKCICSDCINALCGCCHSFCATPVVGYCDMKRLIAS